MSAKIKPEITETVWLSPIVKGEYIKMLQNFMVSFEVGIANMNSNRNPAIILRNFSNLISEADYTSATLECCPENWSIEYLSEDGGLKFTYNGMPFVDLKKYTFYWRNFYTVITPPEGQQISIEVEAHSIEGITDGLQEECKIRVAYPAYITSLEPDLDKSKGIVKVDETSNKYTISINEPFTLKWSGKATSTSIVMLKKDGVLVEGPFFLEGSYDNGPITKSTVFELSVTNDYRYSHIKNLIVDTTYWFLKDRQQDIFSEDDMYIKDDYNCRIFKHDDSYIVYNHPHIYKHNNDNKWEIVSTNNLYNANYTSIASYYYNQTLYISGISSDEIYQLFCIYDFKKNQWIKQSSIIQNPDEIKIGGFAFSQKESCFYIVNKDCFEFHTYGKVNGWGDKTFVLIPPKNNTIISGAQAFYLKTFYIAILCKDVSGDVNVYLYDVSLDLEKYIFKKKVSTSTRFIELLETDNNLWIITENILINALEKEADKPFFPYSSENKRAWLGSNEGYIMAIFPDKNLWVYKEKQNYEQLRSKRRN